ncbi:AMP-binding protein, partial [Streptomyces albidoflavus]
MTPHPRSFTTTRPDKPSAWIPKGKLLISAEFTDGDHGGLTASIAGGCLSELFEEQVRKWPDAVAVVFEDVSLSYAEVNARANVLARELVRRGVGPERIVALALSRSPLMVVALLAVLKAGGAYLPVDPEYPADRVSFLLRDAAPVLVLTDA